MKRELWTGKIYNNHIPPWPCPSCRKGTLTLDKDSLVSHETAISKRGHSHEEFSPDWIDYRFMAWCSCGTCKQKVAVTGTGGVEEVMTSEDDYDWADSFTPQIWNPMPDVFEIPSKCPEGVSEELRAAFALHAFQRAACAGRLRVALEFLMDHVGVPGKKKNAKGRFSELSLHARLTEYATRAPQTGTQLMALKWLGNAGSHDSEVSFNDLMDAFEVFEHALAEIIDKRSERVAGLVKQLTKKYGKKKS